jgi:hypothetical protein
LTQFFAALITQVLFSTGNKLDRLLDLQQTGLLDYWDLWFRPMSPQCTGNVQSGKQMPKNKLAPLSLKNLTGAFLVIAVGFGLSLLAFLCEKIISMPDRHSIRTQIVQISNPQ